MNEELTNEVLEAMKKCGLDCLSCGAYEVCGSTDSQDMMQVLATALLEERAKPKVWDGAPDNAFRSIVNWYDKSRGFIKSKVLTCEPPKTRARQIAEEIASAHISNKSDLVDIIEQMINNHMKELENE